MGKKTSKPVAGVYYRIEAALFVLGPFGVV